MFVIYRIQRKFSKKYFNPSLRLCVSAVMLLFCFFAVEAQSTDQNFPTPVASSEINGKIPARDIGDSRLTSYYYLLDGNQGDVFINVVTANLDGDIDVFTADGLRPLTKIRVYSDNSDSETGRIVYLRQPEKLILRIEGRTPNDDPATFRIKFAGSFVPLKNVAETQDQNSPTVKTENDGEVRVNSVGTIIEVKPKATPKPVETKEEKAETIAEAKTENKKTEAKKTNSKTDETAVKEQEKRRKKAEKQVADEKTDKPEIVITDDLPKSSETVKKEEKLTEEKSDENASKEKTAAKNTSKTNKKSSKDDKPVEPNPLENIRLVVLVKDGTKIERPMSEVLKVGVDKGILTVITKDGAIGRYSVLDLTKFTIE